MPGSKLIGHLAAAGAYIIFGLNIVFCKDIANASAISPIALFSLRALFASALFWLVSIFCPKEQLAKGDFWRIGLASFIGLFVPQYTFLVAITMTTAIDTAIIGTFSPIFTMIIAAIALKEPITAKKAGGVAISFGGILFLIFNSVLSSNGVTQTRTLGIILLLMTCHDKLRGDSGKCGLGDRISGFLCNLHCILSRPCRPETHQAYTREHVFIPAAHNCDHFRHNSRYGYYHLAENSGDSTGGVRSDYCKQEPGGISLIRTVPATCSPSHL